MHSTFYNTWMASELRNVQPDVTLLVGNTNNTAKFLAHKYVLSRHSGYFKTLFSSYEGHEAQISNISSHTFAYLLTFMYTGHLELNPLNVYEIFLASNLLHVTDALNLCKLYLMDGHNYALSIVKPIPRKTVAVSSAFESSRTLKYQPLRTDDEHSSIFKPVRPDAFKNEAVNENDKENSADGEKEDSDRTALTENNAKTASRTAGNVVLDVACCDGPIKFHKVTNKYYDPQKAIAAVSGNEGASHIAATCHGCKFVLKSPRRIRKYEDRFYTNDSTASEPHPDASSANSKHKKRAENPQCHQCKTCGSKFPSYYFVHKHKKLHHQNEKRLAD